MVIHCTAALQAIQGAVCQQRYNYQLWMALSRVCVSLSTTLKSSQEHKNSDADIIKCRNEVYLKGPSMEIVKKAIVLLKPHFKLRHIKEEISCDTVAHDATIAATTTDSDVLWIINALGTAVVDDNNQLCVIKLADSRIFHHFLMILSCCSCLWARYDPT